MRDKFFILFFSFVGLFFAELAFADLAAGDSKEFDARSNIEQSYAGRAKILSAEDNLIYRDIFRLQARGKMKQADAKIAKLENRLLLGHVYYQRYMHPTAYRSHYSELKNWLKHYHDHPNASHIYKMAKKRGTIYGLSSPSQPYISPSLLQQDEHSSPLVAKTKKRPFWRHSEYRAYRKIVRYIRKEQPSNAYQYLKTQKSIMSDYAQARALAHIAKGYVLYGGLDDRVLAVANEGIVRDGASVPILYWWAGLASWRQENYLEAAHYFRKIAFAENIDASDASRGAVWAARALMRKDFMAEAHELLEFAAGKPFTLYGQVASEILGYKIDYRWDWQEQYSAAQEQEFFGYPAVKRALALHEIGEDDRSAREFKRIIRRLPIHNAVRYIRYIGEGELASLALDFGKKLNRTHGVRMNAALFPVPKWQPEDGFRLHPSLIFGFIRQESTFKTNALSVAGASGLMQLMPATVRFISRNKARHHEIFHPEYNMALGQRYIESLMKERYIKNNLFFTTVAYNGGPGNLLKWRRKMDYRDDPLLFLETIPARETRHFARTVVLNYWIYADRFGKQVGSRTHLAMGDWPIYQKTDSPAPVPAPKILPAPAPAPAIVPKAPAEIAIEILSEPLALETNSPLKE